MFSNKEQFSNVAKANFESQLAAVTELTNKAFTSVAQLVELNVNAAKTSFEQSTAAAQQLLAVKDPQEFFTLVTQNRPNTNSVLEYTRSLGSIASAAQAEFAKAAEAQIAETTRKVTALVDDVTKNAPAGSENAIALLKTAISNANAGYEQLTRNAKQASETLEENIGKAARQFTQAAEKTTGRARK